MKGLLGTVALLGICGGIFAAMFFGLMGCSESPVDESGRYIAERSGTNEFNVVLYPGAGEWIFSYVMVDEHEYIVMSGPRRSGLTHSPKCPCLNRKMVFVVDQNQDIQFPNIGVELTDTYINCVTNKVIEHGHK